VVCSQVDAVLRWLWVIRGSEVGWCRVLDVLVLFEWQEVRDHESLETVPYVIPPDSVAARRRLSNRYDGT